MGRCRMINDRKRRMICTVGPPVDSVPIKCMKGYYCRKAVNQCHGACYGECMPLSSRPQETRCFDGRDNDVDGRIDCDDSDCRRNPSSKGRCASTETGRECTDGKDNDHDGKTDCDDSDCKWG